MKAEHVEYAKNAATTTAIALPLIASSRYGVERFMDRDLPDAPLQILGITAGTYGAARPFIQGEIDWISAASLGVGVSSLVASYIDRERMTRAWEWVRSMVKKTGLPFLSGGEIDVHTHDIPGWWSRSKSYKRMARLLTKFVLEDTNNRQTGAKIPAGYRHPAVIQLTRRILSERQVNVYNPIDCAKALTDWCWNHLNYVFDPQGRDLDEDYYTHPYLMIQEYQQSGQASGDCDCMAILLASMFLAVGLTPRYILWAQDQDRPNTYTHITCAIYLKDEKWKPYMPHYPYFNIEPTMKPSENQHITYDFWPKHFRKAIITITE
ncbi:MAG: transglutaminase domain-containing protein [Candidatus Hodarchaeales archaeon]